MLIGNIEVEKRNKKSKKKNRRKGLFLSLLFLVIISIIGNHYASKTLQTKGYLSLFDFTKSVLSNYWNSLKANPEKISIEINNTNYKLLKENRERALERNLIINNIDGDYFPATLNYNGKKLQIKLRLKGHMTDHLQDNKWSFRIRVIDKNNFMGMRRFSFQHPGTRGYVYEWIYHEFMKREDIITLRYKFVNVFINGRDWGVYAIEESFDKELIENNNRKEGPIIRFNPDLYWVDRYNEFLRTKPIDEFASYYSANTEAFSESAILSDSLQRNYYLKSIALIEGLRSKKLSVNEVFDIEQLAKFHAITDLVGGEHSLDWSDTKYYYNPVTGKLEPISYESFTDFPLRELAGSYRYVQLDSSKENYDDWHTALFSNTKFFKAYVKNLERVSEPSYLDKFFSSANIELNNNLKILNKEFPYKKFDKQGYYHNQNMIKKILSPPQAINAYFKMISNNQIHLQIGSIESLPVEINSISINNNNIICLPATPIILQSKQRNQYTNHKDYVFNLPTGLAWDDSYINSMMVNYSILGASTEHQTNVFLYPHTDSEFIADDLKNKKSNINEFPFLEVNEKTKSIFITKGKQIINHDLIIPKGYIVYSYTGVTIDIKNNSKIVSYSPFIFEGREDEPISIESSDSTSNGIEFIQCSSSSFKYVTFRNLPKVHDNQWVRNGAITFYESPVQFINCGFYNSKAINAVNIIRSSFTIEKCLFSKINYNALSIDFSDGTITNSAFEYCNQSAIDINMSKVKAMWVNANNTNRAINVNNGGQLTGNNIKIKNSHWAISANDLSTINIKTDSIINCEKGIIVYKTKNEAGNPSINITGLELINVKKNYIKEKNCSLIINGKEITEEVKNMETNIRIEKKTK